MDVETSQPRITHYAQYAWDAFQPTILLLLGFITFYTCDISIADDMGWYMNSGLNIFLGKGYTDIDGSLIFNRGPVFPFMIAASYWLLGVSPWSAFWVVRIFCILNPIMIYFLGKRFFGKGVGFAAALLILTSYSIDFWSYRHMDAVWPFFVLAATYFTTLGFEKEKLVFFVISGACLGVAILTKEIALLFLPLPMLIFLLVLKFRNKKCFLYAVANILVALMVFVPWFLYLWQNDGLKLLLGRLGPVVATNIVSIPVEGSQSGFEIVRSCLNNVVNFALGVWHYYYVGRNAINANFILAPAFLMAWVFAVIMAIRKNRYAIILVLNFLLFLPILFFVGKNDMRLGQGLFILLLSYLALSWMAISVVGAILKPLTDSVTVRAVISSVVICGLVASQVFYERKKDLGYLKFLEQSIPYNWLKGKEALAQQVHGPFEDEKLEKAVRELMGLADENDAILVDWYTHARAAYFKMGGAYDVKDLPLCRIPKRRALFAAKPWHEGENPLWIDSLFDPQDPLYTVFLLFESDLLEEIREKGTKYILITPRLWLLHEYFSRSSVFQDVVTIGSEDNPWAMYRIYRVTNAARAERPFGPVFTNGFIVGIRSLKAQDEELYENFVNTYIYGIMDINRSVYDKIETYFSRNGFRRGLNNFVYKDADGDGFGDPEIFIRIWESEGGYVPDNTDCNDSDKNEFPNQVWYFDPDQDHHANVDRALVSCTRPGPEYKTLSELEALTYEDGNNGKTTGWSVYDSSPDTPLTPTISNIDENGNRVIQLSGNSTLNGYILKNPDQTPWHNHVHQILKWSMRYKEAFTVYVDLETSQGHRYLTYRPVNGNDFSNPEYPTFGLGTNVPDDHWHTFERNLKDDLKLAQPENRIIEVNGFLIRGSGMIDDIRLSGSRLPDESEISIKGNLNNNRLVDSEDPK